LTALNLGHNEIGQSSTASHKLAEALAGNTHLRELSVSDNGIDLEFVRLLLQSTSLVSLDISMNWLGERAGEMLREALETRMASSLRVLNCSNMSMGCDGARELVKCLGVLEELNLSANDLGSLHRIARPLVLCSTLKRLNLCYSGLGLCGPESAWELAREMKDSNACLEELDLSGNDIGGLGAFSLAEALEAHTVLKKLNLRNNGIDDSGASRLAQALLINTCLRELNLRCLPLQLHLIL
jgi:Ran GTPase-activating protein (RanGAP) involved in mRNA processing and transport